MCAMLCPNHSQVISFLVPCNRARVAESSAVSNDLCRTPANNCDERRLFVAHRAHLQRKNAGRGLTECLELWEVFGGRSMLLRLACKTVANGNEALTRDDAVSDVAKGRSHARLILWRRYRQAPGDNRRRSSAPVPLGLCTTQAPRLLGNASVQGTRLGVLA